MIDFDEDGKFDAYDVYILNEFDQKFINNEDDEVDEISSPCGALDDDFDEFGLEDEK